MKKMFVVLSLLVLVSGMALAQSYPYTAGSYFVDYYANNAGPVPGSPDQLIRIINVGKTGTPLTSPKGDICANIYVFDNNQEMIACCGCQLTPNELASASVGTQLTNNPVTSVVPTFGVVKIALTDEKYRDCDPTAPLKPEFDASLNSYSNIADASLGVVFGTHLQVTGGSTQVTETQKSPSDLSGYEAEFLPTACAFARYLGSGKGTCTCTHPGH